MKKLGNCTYFLHHRRSWLACSRYTPGYPKPKKIVEKIEKKKKEEKKKRRKKRKRKNTSEKRKKENKIQSNY